MYQASAILTGKAKPFKGTEHSAFAKQPVPGPIHIGREGIEGDQQADRKHHGGPHMAVHLYPLDHHQFWRSKIGDHPLLELPGAFGSNLSVGGIVERDVLLGDRFKLGSSLLEVSQPRLPCWKIEHRFQRKGMVAAIVKTGRSGWYFRVVEDGIAQAGDTFEKVESGRTPWTIGEVFSEIANPKAKTTPERIRAMAGCELLAPSWRAGAEQKAAALA